MKTICAALLSVSRRCVCVHCSPAAGPAAANDSSAQEINQELN